MDHFCSLHLIVKINIIFKQLTNAYVRKNCINSLHFIRITYFFLACKLGWNLFMILTLWFMHYLCWIRIILILLRMICSKSNRVRILYEFFYFYIKNGLINISIIILAHRVLPHWDSYFPLHFSLCCFMLLK